MITHRIGRAPNIDLIGMRPPLIRPTIPGKTDLPLTRPIRRPRPNPNIAVRALHDRQIVRRPVVPGIGGIPELEQGLGVPLPGGAALGVAGQAHAGVVEGGLDVDRLAGGDVGGVGALEHLEGGGDLVEGDLFFEVALVADVEGEGRVAGGEGRVGDGGGGDGDLRA